jgi:hypothetical protein
LNFTTKKNTGESPLNKVEFNKTSQRLKQVFKEETLDNLAIESGFTKRKRTVTPYSLALSLVCAMASQRVETIADLVRAFNALTHKFIHYKPFHNQLVKTGFAEFMRGVVELMLTHLTMNVLRPKPDSPLCRFEEILIQDGSSFALKDCLKAIYPGRFTKVTPSAVELHATMGLFSDNVIQIGLAPDTVGEREFLPTPAALRNKLLLADRGYTDILYCHEVDQNLGCFLIRYRKDINPSISKVYSPDGKRGRLRGRLKDLWSKLKGRSIDADVTWKRGKRIFAFRLLILWNPKTKEHVILVTNLPREEFTFEDVFKIYRLRWQIEHVFKEWKSYASLHKFDTGKPAIVEGLIWASLAAAILKRFFAHTTQLLWHSVEISTRRTAMSLRYHLDSVMNAFLFGFSVNSALEDLFRFLRKNAQRAHPKRDRLSGRLAMGLEPCQGLGLELKY